MALYQELSSTAQLFQNRSPALVTAARVSAPTECCRSVLGLVLTDLA